ncbi:Hypothetical predicted protein [Octopus vulgaris]|uniref:Uncharacterized protein n=1 Tax=Octopus vulgaris TaxID=6645 RepID=A0AA36BE29_OCTVU|nr:Hypothetical predicted protein [Octopus vulgaris]
MALVSQVWAQSEIHIVVEVRLFVSGGGGGGGSCSGDSSSCGDISGVVAIIVVDDYDFDVDVMLSLL